MFPYSTRRLLFRLAYWIPMPQFIIRFLRFYLQSKSGENFGDIKYNGEGLVVKKHAPTCQVVFDVGAHMGVWA